MSTPTQSVDQTQVNAPQNTNAIVVITGASRGLGLALAEHYLDHATHVITLSRGAATALHDMAQDKPCTLTFVESDLASDAGIESAAARLRTILKDLSAHAAQRVIIINNAGAVDPVNVVDALDDAHAITRAFCLNVTAPIALNAAVLSSLSASTPDCRVLNISSGAGRNPTPGWSVYCATKAALDMATRVLNAERANQNVRAVALAPGVVDTDMQSTLRGQAQSHFPARDRFVALHEQGKLRSAQDVAQSIARYLNRDDFGATEIDDIRNYD